MMMRGQNPYGAIFNNQQQESYGYKLTASAQDGFGEICLRNNAVWLCNILNHPKNL